MSRPKMGLGVGSFLSGLKGFWDWVILYPDPKGFRMGSKFGPKGFGVSSRTQKGVGWVQSLNPRCLSLGSASGPKIDFGVGLDSAKT